jgi:hypothetical protein
LSGCKNCHGVRGEGTVLAKVAVVCEGCHGSTHAEWPVRNANANNNVTATELQGHTGKIEHAAMGIDAEPEELRLALRR